jgi:hypothetical protein
LGGGGVRSLSSSTISGRKEEKSGGGEVPMTLETKVVGACWG